MISNFSSIMSAIFDRHGNSVSPTMAASIDSHADNISSTSQTINDKYNEHINPRRYEEELPEDLWVQIFLRMPVKSLLLGTCVCKHWYALIKDPCFVRKHLQFQKMMSKSSGHFLLQHYEETAKVYNLLMFDGEFVNSATSSTLPYHNLIHCFLDLDYNQIIIDGPINGLYCLHNQEGCIVIWNPATSEVVFLPFPNDCIPDGRRDEKRWLERGVIGFGKDPLHEEEDYMVILISYCDCDMDDLDLYGFVYTTRTNTWRLIDDHPCSTTAVGPPLNNTYLNGFYYWIGIHFNCTAVVFDMTKKESFRKISTPCDGNLALHNDHINLFSLNENLNEVDIWVMLEQSNWIKKISVRGIQATVVNSLGFWKTENEIILVIDDSEEMRCKNSQPVLYNTTTQETRNFGPTGRSSLFKASGYYESLVSLNGGIKGNDCVASVLKFLLDDSDEETTSSD